MSFTTVDLAVQEILQTNFITDIATIHNSNVLLLTSKLEDLINNLEIDIANKKIGTTNAIASINTNSLVLQDSGFVFQYGATNIQIASLTKDSSNNSVLNVDKITGLADLTSAAATITTLTTTDVTVAGALTTTGAVTASSASIESKELVDVTCSLVGTEAEGKIEISNTSKNNIYVRLKADATVWTGTAFVAGVTKINLIVDFNSTNPPVENTTFSICIEDLTNITGTTSTIRDVANTTSIPIAIKAGTNLSTTQPILLHNDFVTENLTLGIKFTGASSPLNSSITKYGSAAQFNYVIDTNSNDRLIIDSLIGLEVY